MQLIKLEKWEIYDGIHDYGTTVEVYYLQGRGIIYSTGNVLDGSSEIEAIEKFLKNPRDRRNELGKEMQIQCLRDTYLRVIGKAELTQREVADFLKVEEEFQKIVERREKIFKSLEEKIKV